MKINLTKLLEIPSRVIKKTQTGEQTTDASHVVYAGGTSPNLVYFFEIEAKER